MFDFRLLLHKNRFCLYRRASLSFLAETITINRKKKTPGQAFCRSSSLFVRLSAQPEQRQTFKPPPPETFKITYSSK